MRQRIIENIKTTISSSKRKKMRIDPLLLVV